jgi:DNA-nicking Smr family endonuclease
MHEVPIEDSIDLHSFQPREIAEVVEEYLYQALAKGFREVRIIHGRGIGVQREIVRGILTKHPNVQSFHDAPDRGSTTVLLVFEKLSS